MSDKPWHEEADEWTGPDGDVSEMDSDTIHRLLRAALAEREEMTDRLRLAEQGWNINANAVKSVATERDALRTKVERLREQHLQSNLVRDRSRRSLRAALEQCAKQAHVAECRLANDPPGPTEASKRCAAIVDLATSALAPGPEVPR